jgi:hypothetical protein
MHKQSNCLNLISNCLCSYICFLLVRNTFLRQVYVSVL